jgi:formate-nitrite transporter family protein
MNNSESAGRLVLEVSVNDHIQGGQDAPITLVEFGDFECPACGAAYPAVKEVQQRLGDRLRFVFRNYPLEQHPHAEHAAEAAEAAGAQGKFWQMHDYLFEHQDALGDRQLVEDARAVGLDTSRFVSDLEQGTYTGQVEEDMESGDQSGVAGTPTFFINGQAYDGPYNDAQALMRAIEQISA